MVNLQVLSDRMKKAKMIDIEEREGRKRGMLEYCVESYVICIVRIKESARRWGVPINALTLTLPIVVWHLASTCPRHWPSLVKMNINLWYCELPLAKLKVDCINYASLPFIFHAFVKGTWLWSYDWKKWFRFPSFDL